MKRILFIIMLAIACISVSAQDTTQFTREGKNFTKSYTLRTNKDTQTEYTYTIKGGIYNIWITPNGRCYIIRVSKNGNEYKQYLCEEIAREICKELGVTYVEPKNQQ